MNKFLVRVMCVALVLAAVAALLTACGEDTPVVVEPVDHDQNAVIVMTTNPATADILDFPMIIALNSDDLKWSMISAYRHTEGPDNTAVFEVICTDDKSGELQVAYDPDADKVLKADFVYGSKSVSILTDDNAVLMEILAEVNKD